MRHTASGPQHTQMELSAAVAMLTINNAARRSQLMRLVLRVEGDTRHEIKDAIGQRANLISEPGAEHDGCS
jgi:hypothetical protein